LDQVPVAVGAYRGREAQAYVVLPRSLAVGPGEAVELAEQVLDGAARAGERGFGAGRAVDYGANTGGGCAHALHERRDLGERTEGVAARLDLQALERLQQLALGEPHAKLL